MKVKHVIFWHTVATIFLTAILLGGCKKHDNWEWLAGNIYRTAPRNQVCRHRVARIAKQMMSEGHEFDLVFGNAFGKKHVRIEYIANGKTVIIEPTWLGAYDKFTETNRWQWRDGSSANRLIISWVNGALKEIEGQPYRPNEVTNG